MPMMTVSLRLRRWSAAAVAAASGAPLVGRKETVIPGKLPPARAQVTVPERRPPAELLGPAASFFPGEASELMDEGERPPKLPEGFAEELARELSELRAGSSLGDLDEMEKPKEDLKAETDLGSEPEEDYAEAE